MRKDSPLAARETIATEDLWDKPLIISRQDDADGTLAAWMKRKISEIEVVATYNLLFNASLMVEEGLGYAIDFDKIINNGKGIRNWHTVSMIHRGLKLQVPDKRSCIFLRQGSY